MLTKIKKLRKKSKFNKMSMDLGALLDCLTAAVGMALEIFCRRVSKSHCCRLNQLKSNLIYFPISFQ